MRLRTKDSASDMIHNLLNLRHQDPVCETSDDWIAFYRSVTLY